MWLLVGPLNVLKTDLRAFNKNSVFFFILKGPISLPSTMSQMETKWSAARGTKCDKKWISLRQSCSITLCSLKVLFLPLTGKYFDLGKDEEEQNSFVFPLSLFCAARLQRVGD